MAPHASPVPQKVLKVTVFHYRNPDMTEDEYQQHWRDRHAAMAAPWLARHGILKYAIYQTPSSERQKLEPISEAAGLKILDHDGHAEFWVRSLDDFLRALQDPEYLTVISTDEANMLNRQRTEITMGWEEVRMIDGKIL